MRQAAQHYRTYTEVAATVLKIRSGIRSPCCGAKVIELRVGDKLRDVLVLETYILGIAQPTAAQFIPQFQQIDLSSRLAVNQGRRQAGFGYALDLDSAPASDRNVDVLPARSHADANMPGRTTDPANAQNRLFNFLGCSQVRPRHRLDQRHAESVGAPDDEVAAVRNLATAVLFDADLRDRDAPVPEGNTALYADDCSPLESRWNRSVEILLASDMNLVDDVAAEHQALLDGDVNGLLVDGERWRIVHLIGTDVRLVEQINDVFFRLELH